MWDDRRERERESERERRAGSRHLAQVRRGLIAWTESCWGGGERRAHFSQAAKVGKGGKVVRQVREVREGREVRCGWLSWERGFVGCVCLSGAEQGVWEWERLPACAQRERE